MNARGRYRRISLRSPKEDGYSAQFLEWMRRCFPEYADLPPWKQWQFCQYAYRKGYRR